MLRSEVGWTAAFILFFTIAGGFLALDAHNRPKHHVNQRVSEAIVARVKFQANNELKTQKAKENARQRAPSVYQSNSEYFKDIHKKLVALHQTGTDTEIKTFDDIDADRVEQLHLTKDSFAALRAIVGNEQTPWQKRVDRFIDDLAAVAVLSPDRFKIEQNLDKRSEQVVILHPSGEIAQSFFHLHNVADKESKKLQTQIRRCATTFEAAPLIDSITGIVLKDIEPTVVYDDVKTKDRRNALAAATPPVIDVIEPNDVMFAPADTALNGPDKDVRLTERDIRLLEKEQLAYVAHLGSFRVWMRKLGMFGIVMLIAVGLWICVWATNKRIAQNPVRGLSLTLLLLATQAAALIGVQIGPDFLFANATFPTLFVAIVLSIVYHQRFALVVGCIHAMLITVSLQLPVGFTVVLLAGVVMAVAQLTEIRSRSKLVWVGLQAGAVMAITTWLVGILARPLHLEGQFRDIAIDSTFAMSTGLLIGLFVQGILPAIEKMCRVTTAMTLKELNDASNPLLQRLAQEAPGTYQHSLRIADMAESAAEAIGCSGLLCRVGAMYHDIGKSNKPHYFIENQGGGPNRHEKLRPAMSLLIIVSHVKDGIEMAREYRLPREIIQFIKTHHGTTLIEYFYHAAKKSSDGEDDRAPEEFEFRYPGPKPQSREEAILMLCDGVEGAARALDDPTPVRLEQLVHSMATKRLMDGQFDECNLTLKELHKIEAAITKTLCAIYHARIKYPSDEEADQTETTAVAS